MNWLKAYIKAIEIATIAHKNGVRKFSDEPYIVHPLRVSEIVLDHTGNFELACAAVLHDTLEDTTLRAEEITNHFPDRVTMLVESVTKNKALAKPEREAEYNARFSKSGIDTVIIKLADRYDNIRDTMSRQDPPAHFKIAYIKNTVELLKAIPEFALEDHVVEILRTNIVNTIENGSRTRA